MTRSPVLPTHIEDTIVAIAELQLRHHHEATPVQHAVDKVTNIVGRPRFVLAMTVLFAAWILINLMLTASGRRALDVPPFQWLQDFGTLLALYLTVLILITQRRESLLSDKREQLTLELAILSERKATKIIALIEELRRDHPDLRNRIDAEADAMSQRADPHLVLDAVKETHENAIRAENPDP